MAENAFKNFLNNLNSNPVMLAGIVQAIVPVLVVFEIIHWTEQQTAVVYAAVTAITTLFVRGNTVAVTRVEQRVDEKVAHREVVGSTGTGAGMAAPQQSSTPKLPIIILALMFGTGIGCASVNVPPNISFEGKVAIRGTQLVEALRATIPTIKSRVCSAMVTAPCLTPADAVKVFGALETAGRTGEELAKVLTAVDSAKEVAAKTAGMERARALLASISTSLQTALTQPENAEVRTQLVQLFGTVTQLLLAVSTF